MCKVCGINIGIFLVLKHTMTPVLKVKVKPPLKVIMTWGHMIKVNNNCTETK